MFLKILKNLYVRDKKIAKIIIIFYFFDKYIKYK